MLQKSRYLVPFTVTQRISTVAYLRAPADLTGTVLSQTWICKVTDLLCYVPAWCYVCILSFRCGLHDTYSRYARAASTRQEQAVDLTFA